MWTWGKSGDGMMSVKENVRVRGEQIVNFYLCDIGKGEGKAS